MLKILMFSIFDNRSVKKLQNFTLEDIFKNHLTLNLPNFCLEMLSRFYVCCIQQSLCKTATLNKQKTGLQD